MSKKHDAMKQIRLRAEVEAQLEKLRREMPVGFTFNTLANETILAGIPVWKKAVVELKKLVRLPSTKA
jgi:hypothetical protein